MALAGALVLDARLTACAADDGCAACEQGFRHSSAKDVIRVACRSRDVEKEAACFRQECATRRELGDYESFARVVSQPLVLSAFCFA